MPDFLGVPPGVPPDDYASFINAQRQQMLANALMQSAMTPIRQPETQPVKGLYVQPRVGAVQGLSKLAEALLGNRATKQALQSQANSAQQLNQAYAPGGQMVSPGTPLQAAPDASGSNTDASDQGVQPAIARLPGASLAQTVQATQPQFSPQNPRNPQGLPADVVRNLAMTDPAKYAAMLQGPESVQLGRIAGLDPAVAARAALSKQTQTEIRPGATVIDPISGRTMIGADPSKGEYYAIGPNGQVAAFPITNDATLQAWRQGLSTAATQANTPREIPMGGGVTRLGYPPTPPALAGTGLSPAAPGAAPVAGPAPGGAPAAPVATSTPASPGASPSAARAPTGGGGVAGPATPSPARPPAAAGIWSSIPKLQIPSSPGQTSNTYQQKNLENAAAKHAELVNTYGQQTALADQQLDLNRRALAALPNAEVGPMSEFLTTNRQRLIELGVPESLIPKSGTVTPTLELNKELLNSALQGARQIYGSKMTQNEVKLQTEEMSPSSHMTADAIASLVQQGNVQALYSKQRAADYNRYEADGGDPMKFESWYAQNRPLTEFAAQQQMTPAQRATALQRFRQNPNSRADFQRTLGWDPVNWQQ